jgi:hypothetical protein
MFLYHLTQVVPGFMGGVLVLALEGESLLGQRGLLRFRREEVSAVAVPAEPYAS